MDTSGSQITDSDQSLSRAQRRRYDDIVQAALKVFERDGYEAAKMEDIAHEAEVAKGTLYLYFDTKAALLRGVIKSALLPAINNIGRVSQAHAGNAQELLEQHIRVIAARQSSAEMKLLMRFLMSDPEQHQQTIEFFRTNILKEGARQIKSALLMGVASGEFSPDVANLDPIVLIGSNAYTAVWQNLFKAQDLPDVEQLIEDNLRMMMRGLVSRT